LKRIDAINKLGQDEAAPETKTLPTQDKVISVTVSEVFNDDDDLLLSKPNSKSKQVNNDQGRSGKAMASASKLKPAKQLTSGWRVSSKSSSNTSSASSGLNQTKKKSIQKRNSKG
jgi:hypothetical protein